MRRQGLLSVTGIFLLGLIVLMTLHEWGNPLSENERQAALRAPAIIANGITAKSFAAGSGKVLYTLTADHLVQYDHTPKTELSDPDLHMKNAQGVWTIRSKKGEVLDNGTLLVFQDQVHAHGDSNGITLETNELRYNTDTRVIEAPGPVDLNHQRGTTKAGNMRVDLNSGTMKLNEGVVSDYKNTAP